MVEQRNSQVCEVLRDISVSACRSPDRSVFNSGPQVNDGRVRVNYYIKELFSDPLEVEDVWETPLAIITMRGTPEMFKHPVLIKVLDVKWAWMKRGFLLMQSLFALQVLATLASPVSVAALLSLFAFQRLDR